jgi:hypothetical protein
LLFDLKQGPHAETILRQSIRRRLPVPKVIADAPILRPWLGLFQQAFRDLVGDRCGPGQPITWQARQRWAEVHELDPEATELLHHFVVAQDVAFLGYLRENAASNGEGAQSGEPRRFGAKPGPTGEPR